MRGRGRDIWCIFLNNSAAAAAAAATTFGTGCIIFFLELILLWERSASGNGSRGEEAEQNIKEVEHSLLLSALLEPILESDDPCSDLAIPFCP